MQAQLYQLLNLAANVGAGLGLPAFSRQSRYLASPPVSYELIPSSDSELLFQDQ